MESKSEIWYSFKGGKSQDDNLGFYNNSDFQWVQTLEENCIVIKAEIKKYIQEHEKDIKPYFNKNLVTKDKSWKTFAFSLWCWKRKKNMKFCPNTMEILNTIPNVVSACVSILEPDVQIKKHRGDTNAIVRAHLALEAPIQLPDCGFQVNDEQRSWKEGEVLVFNDAAIHTAWNHSDKRRYILLIDVMRPEFTGEKYKVCSMVLGGLVVQSIFQKLSFLKRLPLFCKKIILFTNVVLINLLLRFRALF